jgi:hypothetical protein
VDVVARDLIGKELTVVIGFFYAMRFSILLPLDVTFEDAEFASGYLLVVTYHLADRPTARNRCSSDR